MRPAQPLLRNQHGNYLVVAREPFITYEDSDLPWLTYCGKTRPAGRGEGRTTRFIEDVAEQLQSGQSVLLVGGNFFYTICFASKVLEAMADHGNLPSEMKRHGPWEFRTGATLRLCSVRSLEDSGRGLRPLPLIMFDHRAEEIASPRQRDYARMHNAVVLSRTNHSLSHSPTRNEHDLHPTSGQSARG